MNKHLVIAKAFLDSGYSLGVVNGGGELPFKESGVVPLMRLQNGSLGGAFVADKVVGKAAALLLVRGGAIQVYADVMSEPAIEVLSKHKILWLTHKRVKNILNADGTDICPMERAVLEVDDPEEAFEILVEKTGFNP